jgi:hypothetical protein
MPRKKVGDVPIAAAIDGVGGFWIEVQRVYEN